MSRDRAAQPVARAHWRHTRGSAMLAHLVCLALPARPHLLGQAVVLHGAGQGGFMQGCRILKKVRHCRALARYQSRDMSFVPGARDKI